MKRKISDIWIDIIQAILTNGQSWNIQGAITNNIRRIQDNIW